MRLQSQLSFSGVERKVRRPSNVVACAATAAATGAAAGCCGLLGASAHTANEDAKQQARNALLARL